MKYQINEEVISELGYTMPEFTYLLCRYLGKFDFAKLVSNGLVLNSELTDKGRLLVEHILVESTKEIKREDDLEVLALKLKEIYPKGRNAGGYYWTDGIQLIVKRLQLFFKKYGNSYKAEDIIKATQSYVDGFNGNYTLMRLLKYFIWKEATNHGEVESSSDLYTILENMKDGEVGSNTWIDVV